MVLQQKFRKSPEIAVSYDFSDLIQNQGVANFYVGDATDSEGAATKILSRTAFETNNRSYLFSKTYAEELGETYEKVLDHDFDIELGTTQIVEGQALAQITYNLLVRQTSGTEVNGVVTTGGAYMIVRVRKYSGSTETEVGIGQSETKTRTLNGTANTSSEATYRNSIFIDCTRTKFKRGDILRVTIEAWINLSAARYTTDYTQITYYTDPLNRKGIADNYGLPTQDGDEIAFTLPATFNIAIPFTINI